MVINVDLNYYFGSYVGFEEFYVGVVNVREFFDLFFDSFFQGIGGQYC